jgi:TonB-linked SusC/RagA family outer membrane protein
MRQEALASFKRRGMVCRSRGVALALTVGLLVVSVVPVQAQTGAIGGTVVAGKTLRPLAGAQVVLMGTKRGTLTDSNGRFLIPGVAGTTARLQVVMIGYKTETLTVPVGKLDIEVSMQVAAVALNRIVVTGQPGGARAKSIGNSVDVVDAATVASTQPVNNVQDMLDARAPAVSIMRGTGMVGAGSRIRIRGITSFSLSGNPLIYVDGIRVDNESNSGISIQAFGSAVVSRLNDFDPAQIESIQVLKGAAATTLFGTEAARGVINIITKKGAPGATTYNFTIKQGANWFSNPEGRMPTNYWRDPSGNMVALSFADLQKLYGRNIFRTGGLQTYDANVSGGSEVLRYFVAGDLTQNQGAEPNNFKNQFSGRVNLDIQPSSKIHITTSAGYVNSRTELSCEAGCGGAMWDATYSTPAHLPQYECAATGNAYGCGFQLGFRSWTPEAERAMLDYQMVHRFTGSVNLEWKPFKWMTHRLVVGTDLTEEKNPEHLPYLTNDTLIYFWGPYYSKGYTWEDLTTHVYRTFDYAGTVDFDVNPHVNSSTSFGLQYYTKHMEFLQAEGDQFSAPGLSTINATATQVGVHGDYEDNFTLGMYGQEQVALNDRLFLTAAVRVDNNSAFGSDFQWVVYPKASLSWVLNEEPAVRRRMPDWIDAFKLRMAYGESGQQPQAFSALRTYEPVTGSQDRPAITPQAVGNPNLGPERVKEIEAGFDAGLFNDRVGAEFTYFHNRTVDGILLRPVPPSSGFPGSQYVNAGEITGHGIEVTVHGSVLNLKNFGWDLAFNVSTNHTKVTKLYGNDTTIVTGSTQYKLGYPANAWFRERAVSATYDPTTGRATNIMCDDGNGGTTPCYGPNGEVLAPRVYMGNTQPTTTGGITSTFMIFSRLQLNTVVDFSLGNRKWDNNLRVRCQIFLTCLENMNPEQYDPALIAGIQSNDILNQWIINDASFAKLREVSLRYTMPASFAQKIGAKRASITIAGRNLHTWSKWTGLDPENMFLGGPTFLEQDNLPQLMQFVTTINVSF